MRIPDSEIRHIVRRAEAGHITAKSATEQIIAAGYLAIGTAVSSEGYEPFPVLTAYENGKPFGKSWHPRVPGQSGGAMPVVRASRVPQTAVWAGFGGDANQPQQRQREGLSFTPDKFYALSTFGWSYSYRGLGWAGPPREYEYNVHGDLVAATQEIPDDRIIGAVDFVPDDGSFIIEIPDEPGHVASVGLHARIATIPVRMGDTRPVLDTARRFSYSPLSRG